MLIIGGWGHIHARDRSELTQNHLLLLTQALEAFVHFKLPVVGQSFLGLMDAETELSALGRWRRHPLGLRDLWLMVLTGEQVAVLLVEHLIHLLWDLVRELDLHLAVWHWLLILHPELGRVVLAHLGHRRGHARLGGVHLVVHHS